MEVLTEALDDPAAGRCGRCSVCTGELPGPGAAPNAERLAAAAGHLRGRSHTLEPRKLWPTGSGRKGKIGGVAPGRALAFADDPAWTGVIAELAGPDDEPSPDLCDGLVAVLKSWAKDWTTRPVAVVPVPSRSRPRRVAGMAAHVAAVGRLPLLDVLAVDGPPPPEGTASATRVEALLSGLRVAGTEALPRGPVLLVDDVMRTGWTLTVAAALLGDAGAEAVFPLVGHRKP
jgi:ATP-dependent DNA helicase RecQ